MGNKKEKEAKSGVFLVIFEHIKGNMVRKGNKPIVLIGKQEVTSYDDVAGFQKHLVDNNFVDPVVIDWIPLGVQDPVPPNTTPIQN